MEKLGQMEPLKEFWLSSVMLEAVYQASHEWFAAMGAHGPRIFEAFEKTRPAGSSTMASTILLTVSEADALAHAAASAIVELTGRTAQSYADRRYRRALADALCQLSKVVS